MDAQHGKTVAMALTNSRLPIGMLAGTFLFLGQFSLGFTIYALGLVTDVADGWVARKTGGTSAEGAAMDRQMDIVFNLLSVAGYCAGAAFIWGDWHWALAPFVATGGLVVITRPFFQPNSAASKIRSGVIRCFLLGFICAKLPWNQLDLTTLIVLIAFGIPAIKHEWDVTKEEVRTGKRRWFKRPLLQS